MLPPCHYLETYIHTQHENAAKQQDFLFKIHVFFENFTQNLTNYCHAYTPVSQQHLHADLFSESPYTSTPQTSQIQGNPPPPPSCCPTLLYVSMLYFLQLGFLYGLSIFSNGAIVNLQIAPGWRSQRNLVDQNERIDSQCQTVIDSQCQTIVN